MTGRVVGVGDALQAGKTCKVSKSPWGKPN